MIIIIPNFFQLPMSYAISRSVFLIDVKFVGEFDRGYFSFYNFNKKKNLYIRGKKAQDYDLTTAITFVWSPMGGKPGTLSTHSFGIAIDINPKDRYA